MMCTPMQPDAPILQTLANLEGVPSSERSRRVARLLVRNPYGAVMHAGLFGEPLPANVEAGVRDTMQQVRAGQLTGADGERVPSYGYLGDALMGLQPEAQQEMDKWVHANLSAYASERVQETVISEKGAHALHQFYTEYVEYFVVDPSSWTVADTQMVAILLYSYQDFEAPLFSHFGARLGQGIVPSLHAYRQSRKAHPLSIESKSDDAALIIDAFSPIVM